MSAAGISLPLDAKEAELLEEVLAQAIYGPAFAHEGMVLDRIRKRLSAARQAASS